MTALQPPAAGAGPAWAARLQLLLESTGEGIYGIDMAGCCTFVNRAAAQMIGLPAHEVLGRNMHDLIHHRHADGRAYPEQDCPIYAAFRRGESCRIDREVLWRVDGTPFAAEYSSYPIVDGGQVIGAVVTFVDITERRRAEAALREAHDRLEQRVAERTEALTQALDRLRELGEHLESVREQERTRIAREIHDELGSLLVALRMDVNWLARRVDAEPALQGKCRDMGGRIDTAVDTVGRLIDDLRPSILDHQGLWAAMEWQALALLDAAELAHDLRLHVAAGVELPPGPVGERWALAVFRIFQELLSNVLRHARARAVRVRLYVDGPPGPVLHLDVEDDGIGADPAALEHPRSYGVLGMRERARPFGGTLEIRRRSGGGTRARLRMPLPAGPAETGVAAGAVAGPAAEAAA
ncbi:sensor histidine kinase [Piscinibacter sakaiensis]|uniref:Sensory box histidine kinase/response regulator n=1 Tax=Piscinibacter sakaiensis TaxID=1547922 RepID=A0A0K8P0U3_PISS1|nr:PAS domain S-box protein [Piscinibacter sakaiensis]GAP36251.1 sensory box histidine kinase/response regulator [Piscinibacter sakaiensis]